MPRLALFGMAYDVDGTLRSFPLGAATLKLQLAAGAVSVSIDGPFAGLIFRQLAFTLPCTVLGSEVNLTSGTPTWTGSVDIKLGDYTAPLGLSQIKVPSPDPAFGVSFATSQAAVFKQAMELAGRDFLSYAGWSFGLTSTLMSPDATGKFVEIWPLGSASTLTIRERFGQAPTDPLVQQDLVVERIRLMEDAFETMFWPNAGALYLNADVLDPTRKLDADKNGFHFQHIVAETYFSCRFAYVSGLWRNAGWFVAPAEREGSLRLAAPVLKDEHGHPLLFSVSGRIPVGGRNGHVKPLPDALGESNRATVLGDSFQTVTVAAKMETVDPVALYAVGRTPKPLKNQRLQAPYWVQGRKVPRQEKRPRQILGFAADAVLTMDAPPTESAAGPRDPHDVSLVFAPLRGSKGLRFVFPTVEIPLKTDGPAATVYALDLPEQATLQMVGGMPSVEVSRRVATAAAPKVSLPLLDAKWAFADLGTSQTPEDGLAERGAKWLEALDQAARAAFPTATPTTYQHIEGLRVEPNLLPVQRMFAPAPTTTRNRAGAFDGKGLGLAKTVLAIAPPPTAPMTATATATVTAKWMAPAAGSHGQFLFGGAPVAAFSPLTAATSPAESVFEKAADKLKTGRAGFDGPLENFFWFWVGLPRGPRPPGWEKAREKLWDYLVGARKPLTDPATWELEDLVEASSRLEAARGVLARNPPDILGFEACDERLQNASPDEVPELLDPDHGSELLDRLLQYAYAPPTMELANRAVAALAAPSLDAVRPVLEQFITANLAGAIKNLFKAGAPDGFFAELLQGLPPIFEKAQEIWRNREQMQGEMRERLLDLAARYGAELTHDIYAELLKDAGDAELFAQILRHHGLPLARLADLAGEPPDYLVVSRWLRRPMSGDPSSDPDRLHPIDRAAALWNHRFDFCQFGGGKAWDLFLDDQATLIVKLGGTRGIEAILTEATKSYADGGRADPFSLDPGGSGHDPVGEFIKLLPDEVKRDDWRGALIINPKIDLDRDPVLKTLCGFSHIAARFAAIGGRAPDKIPAKIDVWGRIEKVAEASGWTEDTGKPMKDEPSWGGADVAWSLIRFSATIQGTTILSGDIAFKLDIRELFGRRRDWPPITVAATLPKTASVTGKPRDFTFAATFDRPLSLDVDVAFVKEPQLKSIRVGSHDGNTTLDIDAKLVCQDWEIGGFNFEAPKPIQLSDFRIRVPDVEAGRAVAMGMMRSLSFDLGAIKFPLESARRITLAGLDIRPVAVGLMRDESGPILDRLRAETVLLEEPVFKNDAPGKRYGYPFLDTRVEFGRTPTLDGAGQFSLVARVGVPVSASNDPGKMPEVGEPGVGLAMLSGRNLKLSLFRLITLEFESIEAGVFDLRTAGKKAGAIWADGFNLSLLSWPLFKKEDDPAKKTARTLAYVHDTTDERNRGFLAWYASPGAAEGFFKLQWMLIAQNIRPKKLLYDGLMSLTGSDLSKEIQAIRDLKGPNKLNFDVDRNAGWLFGVRFELGELFKPCVLLFHDGVYYGIRLGGPIAKLITGEDDISLAYIPGDTPQLDRFRVALRIAALDMLAVMESGEIALEWNPAWDFLIDIGQPWRGPNGYMWERAFSIPMGAYEAKFGFFVEKRTSVKPPNGVPPPAPGEKYITLSAGAGFYFGYAFSTPKSIAWVKAGIGVFGVLTGSATLKVPENVSNNPLALLKTSLAKLTVTGVLGIYAYGEGGVDVWILSARFRVSAQAFVEVTLTYIPNARSYLTYNATLAASYSASVRVGSGFFSWTFSVSGAVQMSISGSASFG